MTRALLARLEILQHLKLRSRLRSIASWKILIARASAPISSARPVCGIDAFGAFGNLFDGCGDDRKRPRDRTGDDQHADDDDRQRHDAEAGQQKAIVWLVSVCCASLLLRSA